ncbi:MAG: DUF3570 domain-containing protein [Verrucomicrobia bacterium]|nr:DUF3570 domain-containing protein [Verrucomicrobiota bacterium]
MRLGLDALLPCALAGRARADDHVDYRYEYYQEEGDRIAVETHSALFEKKLTDIVTVKGQVVYDAISGSSPTGAPPLAGSDKVPVKKLHDNRRAGNLSFDVHLGRHTLSAQGSYSKESDYISAGTALTDAIEFNNKNTTLLLGVSHNFDRVLLKSDYRHKDATDFIIGVSQLLSPKTILTADFTYGTENGYLSDPYKLIQFDSWLPISFAFPENRPGHRDKEVLQTTLTHFFDPVNASAELSYRFYHDSYGIFSHTASVTWNQKIGKYLVLSPIFRFYEQSEADFYRGSVPGFFPSDGNPARPQYYSADYRLSKFISLTYGLQASVFIREWLTLDLGYHRYEMYALDSATAASAYPNANIYTIGLRFFF